MILCTHECSQIQYLIIHVVEWNIEVTLLWFLNRFFLNYYKKQWLLQPEWTMNEWGKSFRTKIQCKKSKNCKNQSEIATCEKKTSGKRISVHTPFTHSTLKLKQKLFTPQKYSLFCSPSCSGMTKITTPIWLQKSWKCVNRSLEKHSRKTSGNNSKWKSISTPFNCSSENVPPLNCDDRETKPYKNVKTRKSNLLEYDLQKSDQILSWIEIPK